MKHLGSVLTAPAQSAAPSSPIEGQMYYDTDVDTLYVYTTAGWTALGASSSPLDSYPVGAIYMSVVSTSPATLFGGTWSVFAQGRVLVGLNSGDAAFDTVEELGGVKEVTLTSFQSGVPAHNHDPGSGAMSFVRHRSNSGLYNFQTNATAPLTKDIVSTTGNNTGQDAGQAHTNLQPYIVVYMWKRTA